MRGSLRGSIPGSPSRPGNGVCVVVLIVEPYVVIDMSRSAGLLALTNDIVALG